MRYERYEGKGDCREKSNKQCTIRTLECVTKELRELTKGTIASRKTITQHESNEPLVELNYAQKRSTGGALGSPFSTSS